MLVLPQTVSRTLRLLLVSCVLLICHRSAVAVDRFWNVATGDFNTAANWSPSGAPGFLDSAFIDNGGTATLSSTSGDQLLDLFHIATAGGASGTFEMTGGTLAPDQFIIGEEGTGEAIISGGRLDVAQGSLFVGGRDGAGAGVLTVSGAATHVSSADDLIMGRTGTGTLNVEGGRVQGVYTVVGKFGSGVWNQSGGIFDQLGGDIEIGDGGRPDESGQSGPRNGVINLSGGVIYGSGHVAIGNRVGGGEVNVSGGALSVTGDGNGTGTIFVGRGMDWEGNNGAGGAATFRVTGGDGIVVANGGFNMNDSLVASSSTLVAEITGTEHTTIKVVGDALIENGSLSVELNGYSPVSGDSWTLLQAGADISAELAEIDAMISAGGFPAVNHVEGSTVGALFGEFTDADFSMAPLAAGLSWEVGYVSNAVVLSVTGVAAGLAGDYNDDGVVNAADYTVWRDLAGQPNTLVNDQVGGATVGQEHYTQWSDNYGATNAASVGAASAAPEPAAALLAGLAVALGAVCRRAGARS